VKKIGDGITIENEVMYGCVEIVNVQFKMFVCSNHIPKFEDDNEAVFNRYKQIQMCSHFDRNRLEENIDKLEFIGDPSLCDTLATEYSNEVIDLVLEYAMKYYKGGIPPTPYEFQEASAKTKMANNEGALWFNDTFERDPHAKISLDEIMKTPFKNMNRTEMLLKGLGLGLVYNKDFKCFGTKLKDGKEVHIVGCFAGFLRIMEEG
jgi:phage/plasmid-associated DNA primase